MKVKKEIIHSYKQLIEDMWKAIAPVVGEEMFMNLFELAKNQSSFGEQISLGEKGLLIDLSGKNKKELEDELINSLKNIILNLLGIFRNLMGDLLTKDFECRFNQLGGE